MKHNYDFKFNHPTPSDDAIAKHMDFAKLLSDFEKTQEVQDTSKGRNYDFKLNHPIPSDDAIAKHMDFAKLLSDFEKTQEVEETSKGRVVPMRPMFRWLSAAAGVAILVGAVTFFFNTKEDFKTKQDAYFAAMDYVNPPMADLQEAPVESKFVAEKGGTIKSPNGSKYKISPNALQTSDGSPVSGEVTIKYREMHDYVDFFLAGIPMTYDSAGIEWQLESAGMVEITAEQDGKQLQISPEKPIQVELISQLPLRKSEVVPNFNIYKLNQGVRNWEFQNVDNMQIVERIGVEEGKAEASIKKLAQQERQALASIENTLPEPLAPTKPNRANGNNFVFDMDFQGDAILQSESVNASEGAKLVEKYNDAMWQVKPGTGVGKSDINKEWDDVKIKPLSNVDFEMTFVKNGEEFKVKVNPVLSGEEYQEALEHYQGLLADYSEKLEARNDKLRSETQNVKDKFAGMKMDILKNTPSEDDDKVYPTKVINRFSVTAFGIWNCDRPYLPEGQKVEGSFVDTKNKTYDKHTAFFVDKTRNTVVRYLATEGTQVKVNEKAEQLLWVVTEDNQLAVFRPEDFAKLEENGIDQKFLMNVIEQKATSEKDIREILAF